jgi:hypothetical protein
MKMVISICHDGWSWLVDEDAIDFDCEFCDEDFEDFEDEIEYDEDGTAWWFDEEDEVYYYFDEDEDDWIEYDDSEDEDDVEDDVEV